MEKKNIKIVAKNKKAYHDFFVDIPLPPAASARQISLSTTCSPEMKSIPPAAPSTSPHVPIPAKFQKSAFTLTIRSYTAKNRTQNM